MKEIPLTKGKVALVDDEDYERVSQYKWHLNGKDGYAIRNVPAKASGGKRSGMLLHRFILRLNPGDPYVDHKDLNPLNCQRENMRIATHGQNFMNKSKRKTACSSKWKGVNWKKDIKKWVCRIQVGYKRFYLGSFKNDLDAAQAYNFAARIYHGEFARYNE